jgi:hypothetical protein
MTPRDHAGGTSSRSRRVFAALVFCILLTASLGLLWRANLPEILATGSPMPPLQLETAAGVQEIGALASTRTVVVFYDHACPHCLAELTAFDQNIERLHGSTVVLVAIGPSILPDSASALWPRLTRAEHLVWARANGEPLQDTWGLRLVPSIFVFDAERQLVGKYVGETRLDLIFPPSSQAGTI